MRVNLGLSIVILLYIVIYACGEDEKIDALTVKASVAGQTFTSTTTSVEVELTANHNPASIYYTTDNSTPTGTSKAYTEKLKITADTTLKFFGTATVERKKKGGGPGEEKTVKENLTSEVVTETYKFTTDTSTSTATATSSSSSTSSTTSTSTSTTVDVPANKAASLSFSDGDADLYQISGTLTITKATTESDVTHYVLYWGSNSTTKLSGQTEITSIAKTGSNVTYDFAANTSIPSGATHFLVFTKNSGGEMSTGTGGAIGDTIPVVVFSGGAPEGTNFGGRSGADTTCSSAKSANYPTLNCSSIRAFITVSSTDEIRDMPTLYSVPTDKNIVGPTATKIADDWTDLLDNTIDSSLADAGVLSSSNSWFSGSDTAGEEYTTGATRTCTGWTVTSGVTGRIGVASVSANGQWISQNNGSCVSYATFYLLCLCYQ